MAWWRRDHQRAGRSASPRGKRTADTLPTKTPHARRIALGGTAALALVVCGSAWHAAEIQLRRYAHHLDHGPIIWRDVKLIDAPTWMGDSVRRDLQEVVASQCGVGRLDQASLAAAAHALDSIAWTQSIHQVRRTADGKIHVEARYRQPVAAVETRNGYRIIDGQAVLLPGRYEARSLPGLGMPLIVGVRSTPGSTGSPWLGPDLAAGIELVRILEGDPMLSQITAIDVGHRDPRHRVHVVLRTAHGQVRWGLPPSTSYPIEPDAGVKRQLLRRVAAEHGGRIDGGGRVVDIYDGAIYLHPAPPALAVPAGYTSSR